jgi:hypothetical protein
MPMPAVWGFHDYYDVNQQTTTTAHEFEKLTDGRRVGGPRLWIGEAGVLQGAETFPFPGLTAQQRAAQRASAKAFLTLHSPRLGRIYYYSMLQPTEGAREAEQPRQLFDSGLFEVKNEHGFYENKGEARPAYCVLAFADQTCQPTATTLFASEEGGTKYGGSPEATVDPDGLATEVYFEYGRVTEPPGFHANTTPQIVGPGLAPVRIRWTGEPNCNIHYRVVAKNAEGASTGEDVSCLVT